MQHTEKYRFNLIETSDTFSPAPLNENAQTVEAELAALAEVTAAADAALARTAAENKAELLAAIGTHGKTARIATGASVAAPAAFGSVTVDFYPLVVFVRVEKKYINTMVRPDNHSHGIENAFNNVIWEDRTVSWWGLNYNNGYAYTYIVLGVEDG